MKQENNYLTIAELLKLIKGKPVHPLGKMIDKPNGLLQPVVYLYPMEKLNLAEKLSTISDHWNPRIAGTLNGQHVKLVKFKGEFVWHHHEKEDELFYVVKGSFDMHLRDRVISLQEGEFLIVPHGVEHKPVAEEEVEVMLFEPASTLNTGNIDNELTKKTLTVI